MMQNYQLLIPNTLKKGDKVAVVCPSGPVKNPETLNLGVEYLTNLGFEVVVGESCKSEYGYLAGKDEVRANDINTMFADKSIKGIFCARGGYGVHRILDKIDFNMIKENPKYFSGYSDITGLHISINQKCGFVTYHSPMITTELHKKQDSMTVEAFESAVFDGVVSKEITNITVDKKIETLVDGEAVGTLVGGNLCLVATLMGTNYEIDTKGKILFLEDVEEPPYSIDRMLMQLKLAGKFKDCAGVILGGYTDCEADKNKTSLTLIEVFRDVLGDIKKPVVYGLECGHCMPTQTLPLGAKVKLDATNGKINIL